MPVPKVYTKGEGIIASYDYTDISNATGNVEYLIGNMSGANVISNISFYSHDYIVGGALPASFDKVSDIDYDMVLNRPLRIQGTALVSVTLGVALGGSAQITARLRKWAGTTETEIANETSYLSTATGVGKEYTLGLNIPNIINFKKGETLRLTIEVWGTKGAGAGEYGYGCDPKDRISDEATIDATSTTQLKLIIPYIIDI